MTPSVAIFDDRIEFMNPGAFPPGTTPNEFRKRPHSLPINEKIAGTLFKGGKSEGWSRGILNIFTYCKEAGLPEPEYDFVTHFVCLTIRFKAPLTPHLTGDTINDTIKNQLNSDELAIYLLVKDNPGIRRKELSEKAGKSIPTVARQIIELQKKGLIEHKGSNKTGGYFVK